MKKIMAAMVLGMVLLVGSYNTTEAAEMVNNGYEVIVADDGCRIYSEESFNRFAKDHNGQNVTDQIFLNTMRHIRHMAIRG